jgi:hypothetical protein
MQKESRPDIGRPESQRKTQITPTRDQHQAPLEGLADHHLLLLLRNHRPSTARLTITGVMTIYNKPRFAAYARVA